MVEDKQQQRKHVTRMCPITTDLYSHALFSPDAPEYPPLAPVKPRATPYTVAPRVCSVNYRTGTVNCWDNESHGGLYPRFTPASPPPQFGYGPAPAMEEGATGRRPFLPQTFNYVNGGMNVYEPADSPLNRILQRPPTGPWQLVGAAVAHDQHVAPKEKTMLVYAQTVDSARDRYNYRVVDGNSVPLDVGYKIHWKSNGDSVSIPGYHNNYHLKLYETFR